MRRTAIIALKKNTFPFGHKYFGRSAPSKQVTFPQILRTLSALKTGYFSRKYFGRSAPSKQVTFPRKYFGRSAPSKQVIFRIVLRALSARTDGNLFLKLYRRPALITLALCLLASLISYPLSASNQALARRPDKNQPEPIEKQTQALAARFIENVSALAQGANSQERGSAIERLLDSISVPHRREPFASGEIKGINIIAEIGGQKSGVRRRLLLGAHYDRVSVGQGAVDNASGVSAVLELARAFKGAPLKNFSLSTAFFDQEEAGLVGSRKFIEQHRENGLPDLYINFDVFGYGDKLYVMSLQGNSPSATAMRKIAARFRFPIEITSEYPPSDHRSFIAAGVPALSISIIEAAEIPLIKEIFLRQKQPQTQPRIMEIIHTAEDTPDKIDSLAAARALLVVERVIREIDRSARYRP